ncbi:MAG: DUF1631 family protein [Burkholderiaceae bacterium]
MTPIPPRAHPALEAAIRQIGKAAAAVAERFCNAPPSAAALRPGERDLMRLAQADLRRKATPFREGFDSALRDKMVQDTTQRDGAARKFAATDWRSLSLVDDDEVEERMSCTRIAQLIGLESEWELREVGAYIASIVAPGRSDEERNPLRADVVAAALLAGIKAASDDPPSRALLGRELGSALARDMAGCYADILRDLQARGLQRVEAPVRGSEGPGNQLPGINSGYSSLRSDPNSVRGAEEFNATAASMLDGGSAASVRSPSGYSHAASTGYSAGRAGTSNRAQMGPTSPASARADAQLMHLLRRLTALNSGPGALDAVARTPRAAGAGASPYEVASNFAESDVGMMAVNLIRAHREELMHASPGKLDHMVIDVVGSLFDQILSDSRVPPQMARQIARLQLPVLRVALNDTTFFSSRRHPVRRFVNRIASLACAFDDFEDGPGKQFLQRVRELVQEIVEGDFDQIELYSGKLGELEDFIAQQSQVEAAQTPAASTLEAKESELLVQQRYMLALQAGLRPMALQPYLRDFVSQVWSQALVQAVRRDGADSDMAKRFRRAARDLVMSVQPKGSPMLRKKFLMQLPQLMKDLNAGMQLIGWPEAAQKEFFAQLLPAHAESLKVAPLSELDYNMMVKQAEAVFAVPVPGDSGLTASDPLPELGDAELEQRFSPAEAQQVGLVEPSAVDWSRTVDIELDDEPANAIDNSADVPLASTASMPLDMQSTEPPEPSRGLQLMDHINLGFAYQMLLKDEWQKVRLTYVSPARSFFVFTRGRAHQETISMTTRMLARMCESGRLRAVESAYLMERATLRARKQLAALRAGATPA